MAHHGQSAFAARALGLTLLVAAACQSAPAAAPPRPEGGSAAAAGAAVDAGEGRTAGGGDPGRAGHGGAGVDPPAGSMGGSRNAEGGPGDQARADAAVDAEPGAWLDAEAGAGVDAEAGPAGLLEAEAGDAPSPDAADSGAPAAVLVEQVAFNGSETADIALPPLAPGGSLVIGAGAGAGRCLQITSWRSPGGDDWLAQVGYGPFCATCAERTQVSVGPGLFVLPTAGVARAGGGALRVGLRDCPTFGSTDPASGLTVAVTIEARDAAPAAGSVRLRPVRLGGSPFAATAAELDSIVASVAGYFAPIGISVLSEPACDAEQVSGDAAFSEGDHGPLGAAEKASWASCPRLGGTVSVLFAGCLTQTSAVGETSELDAFTPHIVGGAADAVADAIFVKGRLCGTPSPVAVAWSATVVGRVVAHELGHYLGLFHAVESDGTEDLLADTTADNLMYFRPLTVAAPSFSALQGAVMRRHPVLSPAVKGAGGP